MAKKSITDIKFDKMATYCKGTEYVSFDLETTGQGKPENFPYLKIIEIGAVKIKDGKIIDKFQSFINPHIKIPAKIIEITGIDDSMVRDAPDFHIVIKDFKKFCGNLPMIAHNAQFDCGFLYYFSDLIGVDFYENPIIDTLVFSKKLYPKEKVKLSDLALKHGILQLSQHRADDDAKVLAKIFLELLNEDLLKTTIENAPEPNLEELKINNDKYKNSDYKICTANYWEKGNFKRFYITINVENEYFDLYYDLVGQYWAYKIREQAVAKIDFSIVNKKLVEFIKNEKTVLEKYLKLMKGEE